MMMFTCWKPAANVSTVNVYRQRITSTVISSNLIFIFEEILVGFIDKVWVLKDLLRISAYG
jgi:hypothetical protein